MDLRLKIFDMVAAARTGQKTVDEATEEILLLFALNSRYSWLKKDDLEFAIALQEENRLEALKWLCEKARPHTLTPLKTAKDILGAYC